MNVWAFSDIHGQRELFDAIMAKIEPNDKIYFLGDAIDRGPDGWTIFKQLMDDPRVTFICGNHEDMMYNALRRWPDFERCSWTEEMSVWDWNGNNPTIEAILADEPDVVKSYLDKIPNLPVFETYINSDGDIFWLSHAGLNFTNDIRLWPNRQDFIWDRRHFISQTDWKSCPDNLYIIHGHTPVIYLVDELNNYFDNIDTEIEPGAYYYCEGHKIDIDCGAHFTNQTVLFNLDTFDEEIFDITK